MHAWSRRLPTLLGPALDASIILRTTGISILVGTQSDEDQVQWNDSETGTSFALNEIATVHHAATNCDTLWQDKQCIDWQAKSWSSAGRMVKSTTGIVCDCFGCSNLWSCRLLDDNERRRRLDHSNFGLLLFSFVPNLLLLDWARTPMDARSSTR
jgi:hypothetical protein